MSNQNIITSVRSSVKLLFKSLKPEEIEFVSENMNLAKMPDIKVLETAINGSSYEGALLMANQFIEKTRKEIGRLLVRHKKNLKRIA